MATLTQVVEETQGMPRSIDEPKLKAIVAEMQQQPRYYGPDNTKRLAEAEQLYRQGRVHPDPAGIYFVESRRDRDEHGQFKKYRVDDKACDCPDSLHREVACAHMQATVIQRKMHAPLGNPQRELGLPPTTVNERLAGNRQEGPQEPQEGYVMTEEAEVYTQEPETPLEAPERPGEELPPLEVPVGKRERPKIKPEFVTMIKGKRHIQHQGLVLAAQEDGLRSLVSDWTFNDAGLSLAHAVAIFEDGRRFENSGDATPENVTPMVKLHFRRVALTRAEARALRNALGIGDVAVEELADTTADEPPVPDMTQALPVDTARQEIKRLVGLLGHTITGQKQAARVLEDLGIAYAFTESNYGKIVAKLKELAHV